MVIYAGWKPRKLERLETTGTRGKWGGNPPCPPVRRRRMASSTAKSDLGGWAGGAPSSLFFSCPGRIFCHLEGVDEHVEGRGLMWEGYGRGLLHELLWVLGWGRGQLSQGKEPWHGRRRSKVGCPKRKKGRDLFLHRCDCWLRRAVLSVTVICCQFEQRRMISFR